MPGSISAPNSGSLMKNKKNPGSQMGHTHKKVYNDVNSGVQPNGIH
jgi:hypothetical protein